MRRCFALSCVTLLALLGCGQTPEKPASAEPIVPADYAKWEPEDLLAHFRDSGVLLGQTRSAILEASKSVAPDVAEDGIRFVLPELEPIAGPGAGGRVWTFSKPQDMQLMRGYYEDLQEKQPDRKSWLYERDNILLQINGQLPEERAKVFEALLKSLSRKATKPAAKPN